MLLELEQDSALPPIGLATSPTPSLADADVSATVVGWGNTEDGRLHLDSDGPGSTDAATGVCTDLDTDGAVDPGGEGCAAYTSSEARCMQWGSFGHFGLERCCACKAAPFGLPIGLRQVDVPIISDAACQVSG